MEASTTGTGHGVADYSTMATAYGGNREEQPDYVEANTQNGAKSHKLCTDETIIDDHWLLSAMCDFIDFENMHDWSIQFYMIVRPNINIA